MNYEPILFFGNSNIFPAQEANRRYEALEQVAHYFELQLIRKPWEHTNWREAVSGHENDLEKGERCTICFNYNLREARAEAQRLGIGHFTTTLTVSPHKDSPLIFSIGQDLDGFLELDFKKKGGYQRSIELSKALGIYRQQYCGCEFSLRESMQNKKAKSHDSHTS